MSCAVAVPEPISYEYESSDDDVPSPEVHSSPVPVEIADIPTQSRPVSRAPSPPPSPPLAVRRPRRQTRLPRHLQDYVVSLR